MTFAPRFSPDGKIVMSFAKDGNSDIYTMDLDSRVVERIIIHSSIDTSPSFSPDGKLLHSTLTVLFTTNLRYAKGWK